jgi:hypothetical protein
MSDEWVTVGTYDTIDDAEWAKCMLVEAEVPAIVDVLHEQKLVDLRTKKRDAERAWEILSSVEGDESPEHDAVFEIEAAAVPAVTPPNRVPDARPNLRDAATSLSIRDLLDPTGELCLPAWDLVRERITLTQSDADTPSAWADACREWLAHTANALGEAFAVVESEHVQLLAPYDHHFAAGLLANAENIRRVVLDLIPGVSRFTQPGKIVVLCLHDYYSFVSAYYPDQGEFAGSGGMFIPDGYPHVVLPIHQDIVPGLAHELTHAGLSHLRLPAWLEEGITQHVEFGARVNVQHVLTEEDIKGAKWFWRQTGLAPFWTGRGFHTPGRTQQYTYQLADWIFRILAEEHRPAWFGLFGSAKRKKLHDFVASARADDFGAAAAERHLGYTLGSLAAKFLGPGDWEPGPVEGIVLPS